MRRLKFITHVPEYLHTWNYGVKLVAGVLASGFETVWGKATCCRLAMEVTTMEWLGEV